MTSTRALLKASDDLVKAAMEFRNRLSDFTVKRGEVDQDKPLSTFEAAQYLGCCAHTLRTLVEARQIFCERVGRHMKFRVSELDRYKNRGQRKAA